MADRSGGWRAAVRPIDALDAQVLVEMHYNLNIDARPEDVAVGKEALTTQRWAVMDLTVAHERQMAGLVADRLIACHQIDDAQAALTQRDPLVAMEPERPGSRWVRISLIATTAWL